MVVHLHRSASSAAKKSCKIHREIGFNESNIGMKEILEVIGAVVVTTVILGIPVLSFVSFIYNWHGFLEMVFIVALAIDFLFVLNKLLEES